MKIMSTHSLQQFRTVGALAADRTRCLTGAASDKKEQPESPGNRKRVLPTSCRCRSPWPVRKIMTVTKTYSGTLEGEEQANIVAKISERVTSVNVRVGQVVGPGSIAIGLDKSGVSSQYFQAEANFKNSEKTLQRMKSLYDEGAVSLQTLDGAQTAFDVAKANFDAARSTVELACSDLRNRDGGERERGRPDDAGGGARDDRARRQHEDDLQHQRNRRHQHRDRPAGGGVFRCSVGRESARESIIQLSKSADIGSRSFEVKALFPNTSDNWFKPGMFCKAAVQLSPRENALVIPSASIQSDGVVDRVYLLRGGRSIRQIVDLGISDGDTHRSPPWPGSRRHRRDGRIE